MSVSLLSLLFASVLLSGTLHIRAEYRGPRASVYLVKPLTVLLIITLAVLQPQPASPVQRGLLLAALGFSLLGDVFLMLPGDRFIAGLASFLIAHLWYIAAFSWGVTWQASQLWVLLPFLAIGGGMLAYLWPHLGHKRIPVLVYMLAIVGMAWRGASRFAVLPPVSYLIGLLGICSFLASDSMLAIDRFVKPFHPARTAVMTTYYLAQVLIVLSFSALP